MTLMTCSLIYRAVLAVGPMLLKALLQYALQLAKKAFAAILYMQRATALSFGCYVLERRLYHQLEVNLIKAAFCRSIPHPSI